MGNPIRVNDFSLHNGFYIRIDSSQDSELWDDIVANILFPQAGPPGGLPLGPRLEPVVINSQAQSNQQPVEKDLIEVEEMPLGTECSMMCDTIPAGCGVKIVGSWFDLRYILKYMLTQNKPFTPQKQILSSKDLEIICKKLGITTDQFKNLFLSENRERSSREQTIGLVVQLTFLALQAALQGGGRDFDNRIQAIEQQIEELNNRPDRTVAFKRLLDKAVEEKKITREFAIQFASVLN